VTPRYGLQCEGGTTEATDRTDRRELIAFRNDLYKHGMRLFRSARSDGCCGALAVMGITPHTAHGHCQLLEVHQGDDRPGPFPSSPLDRKNSALGLPSACSGPIRWPYWNLSRGNDRGFWRKNMPCPRCPAGVEKCGIELMGRVKGGPPVREADGLEDRSFSSEDRVGSRCETVLRLLGQVCAERF
jgi:hypothetical protein